MRVLVAHGSKRGGTAGIAEVIGAALVDAGQDAEVRRAADVGSLRGYDAAIIGGSLYVMRWHPAAHRLVRRQERALRTMPVWLFSSGPLDDSASRLDLPPVGQVRRLMERIEARGHRTFGGRLPADATGFPAAAMARDASGDWRDLRQIRAWAAAVATELTEATPVA